MSSNLNYVLDRNRIRIYDQNGKLLEDRDATFEDLLNILQNQYVLNITIDTTKGQGQGQFKKVK